MHKPWLTPRETSLHLSGNLNGNHVQLSWASAVKSQGTGSTNHYQEIQEGYIKTSATAFSNSRLWHCQEWTQLKKPFLKGSDSSLVFFNHRISTLFLSQVYHKAHDKETLPALLGKKKKNRLLKEQNLQTHRKIIGSTDISWFLRGFFSSHQLVFTNLSYCLSNRQDTQGPKGANQHVSAQNHL